MTKIIYTMRVKNRTKEACISPHFKQQKINTSYKIVEDIQVALQSTLPVLKQNNIW